MIKTRFSILLHTLTLLADNQDKWLSSSYISRSININPVLVRNEIGHLKKMNWVESKEGAQGGIQLAKQPEKILLSEIFELAKDGNHVFSLGKNDPNPKCNIGKQINTHLTSLYTEIDQTIVNKLKSTSLLDFRNQF